MVKFARVSSSKEAVAVWSETGREVSNMYREIWEGSETLPEREDDDS